MDQDSPPGKVLIKANICDAGSLLSLGCGHNADGMLPPGEPPAWPACKSHASQTWDLLVGLVARR